MQIDWALAVADSPVTALVLHAWRRGTGSQSLSIGQKSAKRNNSLLQHKSDAADGKRETGTREAKGVVHHQAKKNKSNPTLRRPFWNDKEHHKS